MHECLLTDCSHSRFNDAVSLRAEVGPGSGKSDCITGDQLFHGAGGNDRADSDFSQGRSGFLDVEEYELGEYRGWGLHHRNRTWRFAGVSVRLEVKPDVGGK